MNASVWQSQAALQLKVAVMVSAPWSAALYCGGGLPGSLAAAQLARSSAGSSNRELLCLAVEV